MKQLFRLFLNPRQFFNQLQWSQNHWFFLITFLGLVTIDTQIGHHQKLYQMYALVLENQFQMNLHLALWLVMASRMAFSILGAYLLVLLIDVLGSQLGRRNSKRVLFRRFAFVLSVFLLGLLLKPISSRHLAFEILQLGLMGWSVLLGFFALKEHFHLRNFEAFILGFFVLSLLHFSTVKTKELFDGFIKKQIVSYVELKKLRR